MSSRSMGFVSHAKRTKAIEESMIWDHQIPSNYVNYSIGFNMFDEIAHTYSIVFGWPFRLACLQFATYYILGVRNRMADKNRKRTLENTLPWSFSIRCKTLKLNKHYLELCKWKILFTSQAENTSSGTFFSRFIYRMDILIYAIVFSVPGSFVVTTDKVEILANESTLGFTYTNR